MCVVLKKKKKRVKRKYDDGQREGREVEEGKGENKCLGVVNTQHRIQMMYDRTVYLKRM